MNITTESSEIELWSMEGGDDSNVMMLPGKKSKKRKGKDQDLEKVKLSQQPKLSKSQKRKLRKLEEEKEKEVMLAKSIENFEKYKISELAYAFLKSSKSIGRAETKMDKRRMAVEFSKAGLQNPHTDISPKETGVNDSFVDSEPEFDQISSRVNVDQIYSPEPMVLERDVTKALPDSRESPEEFGGSVDALPAEIVSNEDKNVSLDEGNKPTSKADEIPSAVDSSRSSNKQNCPLQRHIITPTFVHVSRPDEVENTRKDLPIIMMEQEIMEAIKDEDNEAVILCGETGSGKTTQVPQFLYEAGYGSKGCSDRSGIIGITQPRRVAVLATAKRVAYELSLGLGKEVGFQVRHDKKIGNNCSIKFMTDGILLRELQNDFLLRRYSVLILDEAHERSLNTDILIGMLTRVIRERKRIYEEQKKMLGKFICPEDRIYPLKLILMSATLQVEDFQKNKRLFANPLPVISVPNRQYKVTVHFTKRTEEVDYIGQAFKKVMAIHKRLPPGGILVFVTGQREVEYLCSKLRRASRDLVAYSARRDISTHAASDSQQNSADDANMKDINEAYEIPANSSDQQTDRFSSYDEDQGDLDDDVSDTSYDTEAESDLEFDGEVEDTSNQDNEENGDSRVDLASLKAAFETLAGKDVPKSNCESLNKTEADKKHNPGALHVLPLYAMLPAAAQLRVFEKVKEGERLVVVATNVAETSLTIPGIKYVVDTGREKVKNYSPGSGIESYEVQWISQASACQRAGRAGRTEAGHCYHLYTASAFGKLPEFSSPEIVKVPVDGVVLVLKSMAIEKVRNFPFPTPPKAESLAEAVRCLKNLEALEGNERLTSLGKEMAHYPMSPRHSRMLLTAIQIMKLGNCARPNLVFAYAVAAAAALSLSYPFVMQVEGSHGNTDDSNEKTLQKQEKQKKKKLKEAVKASRLKFCNPSSDALTISQALQSFELSRNHAEFCQENALHLKTMEEMSKLRQQLLQLVFNQNAKIVRDQNFAWTHGTINDVEHSWRDSSPKNRLSIFEEKLIGKAICAGWADRVARRLRFSESTEGNGKVKGIRYQACPVKETVLLHRWSSLSKSPPEFLVYSEMTETVLTDETRRYMNGATSVESSWLVQHANALCSFSAPLTDQTPFYEPESDEVYNWVVPSFGPHLWPLPKHSLPVAGNEHRVAVFAFALLEGQVLPCLRAVRKFMSASPFIVLKAESYGQKRVGNLLYKLRIKSIDCCAGLRKAWEADPDALKSEIFDWFQDGFQKQFGELWKQMLNEVVLEPRERFSKKVKRDKKKQ